MEERVRARLSPSEGRRFAFTVGLAFLALAGVLRWRGHGLLAAGAGALAGVLLLAGLVVPGRLGPLYRSWMRLAHAIARVTTPVFMGVLYFGLITPTAILRRFLGGTPVIHRLEGGSYWKTRRQGERESDLERQF